MTQFVKQYWNEITNYQHKNTNEFILHSFIFIEKLAYSAKISTFYSKEKKIASIYIFQILELF